jgi:hypothetical protein
MELDEVERLLEHGERIGFLKPADDPAYLGWILLSKVKPNLRFLQLVTPDDDPKGVAEERRRAEAPYMLLRVELKRSVHEAGDYETEQDYRQKESFWFRSLDEVEGQLTQWGYSLAEAMDARELDAP